MAWAQAGVMAERVDIGAPVAAQNLRGKGNEARGCSVGIRFEVGERRHRLVVEIESARRDRSSAVVAAASRSAPWSRARRMPPGGPSTSPLPAAGEHVTPPLQPDLAGHRLAHDFAHARDLNVEGVEGKQRPAPFARSEESRPGNGPCQPRGPAPRNGRMHCCMGMLGSSDPFPAARDHGRGGRFSAGSSASIRVVPTPR